MIFVSLPLILVAVALLVLGLTGGSSNLLISSIVASLLAAVALVVGARQGTAGRRVAQETVPDPAAPEFAAEPPPPRRVTDDFPPAGETFAAESASSQRDTVQFEPELKADDAYLSGLDDDLAGGRRDDVAGGYRDDLAGGHRDDVAGTTASASGARRDDAESDYDGEPAYDAEPDYDAEPGHRGAGVGAGADYGVAAEAIHGARSEDEQAWRRPGHAEDAAPSAAADEFAEPDEDDPADEPLPQSVRPADAVRVARMDAEVLVVDGRPRYHVPDCPHLISKLTEPIPVDEAVELGFSPCGLCRPVDRLVAAAAQH